MTEDLEALRLRVAAVLPARLGAVAATYERFTSLDPPEDAKGFAAWHGAAKAALAHMELLVKLARWAEGGGSESLAEGDPLEALLAQARAAVAMDDDGDGG
jgi:hypothetical protein